METPDRIDELFVERSAQPVADRLHVLAGEVKLSETPGYVAGAAESLLSALCRRYNFVVCDVPFSPLPFYRDLLDQSHQRIVVMEPTLASIRDALRILALPGGAQQGRRPVLVLNRLGMRGALTRRKVEEALKMKIDVVMPDLPRSIQLAATMGEAAVASRNGFSRGIVELARQTAFVRLLDGPKSARENAATDNRRRWRLFSWA